MKKYRKAYKLTTIMCIVLLVATIGLVILGRAGVVESTIAYRIAMMLCVMAIIAEILLFLIPVVEVTHKAWGNIKNLRNYAHPVFSKIDIYRHGWNSNAGRQLLMINTLYGCGEVDTWIKENGVDDIVKRRAYLKQTQKQSFEMFVRSIVSPLIFCAISYWVAEYLNQQGQTIMNIAILLLIVLAIFTVALLMYGGALDYNDTLKDYEIQRIDDILHKYNSELDITLSVLNQVALNALYSEKEAASKGKDTEKKEAVGEAIKAIENREVSKEELKRYIILVEKKKSYLDETLKKCVISLIDDECNKEPDTNGSLDEKRSF